MAQPMSDVATETFYISGTVYFRRGSQLKNYTPSDFAWKTAAVSTRGTVGELDANRIYIDLTWQVCATSVQSAEDWVYGQLETNLRDHLTFPETLQVDFVDTQGDYNENRE